MPLVKRPVSPTTISRVPVPNGIQNDLEYNTNATLANVILQLSSLSKHAEDLFGDLFREADLYSERTNMLQMRINRLGQTVTQLDSTAEEVSVVDIHTRKAFRSSLSTDSEFFRRSTLPQCMVEAYNQCDQPPPLDRLDQFREDGKSSMKFYTDPDYFFELWRKEMEDNTRQNKIRHKRRVRPANEKQQKSNIREAQRTNHQHQAVDAEFRTRNVQHLCQEHQAHQAQPEPPAQTVTNGEPDYINSNGAVPRDQYEDRRNSTRPLQPPPAPPPERQGLPPPPPPPPVQNGEHRGVSLPVSPVVMAEIRQSMSPSPTPAWPESHLPPPPPPPDEDGMPPPPPSPPYYPPSPPPPSPPPPPPLVGAPPSPGASLSSQASSMTTASAKSSAGSSQLPGVDDDRSGLLSAIRKGIQLRKVEQKVDDKQNKVSSRSDVAAIIRAVDKIRQVIENESDSDEEEDWDSC